MFVRHPDQFFHPQFWVEGANIYSSASWGNLFEPTAGYLCFIEKLIINIIISIPFLSREFHPEVAFYSTIIITGVVLLYFQLTPSRLPKISFFALAIVLSPHYGSEVFAKFLYLIWILPLSMFFLLFRDSKNLSWKIIYTDILLLIIAGLSGPLVILLLPALLFVTMVYRNNYFYKLSFVGIVCSIIQGSYLKNASSNALSPAVSFQSFTQIFETLITNFIPQYLFPGNVVGLSTGLFFLAIFSSLVFFLKIKLRFEAIILAIVFLSTSIPPIFKYYPDSALVLNLVTSGGARYFFYPFLSITFYLFLVIISANVPGRLIAIAIFSIAFYSNLPSFQASSFDFKWKQHLEYANLKDCNARIPIPFDGKEGFAWVYESNIKNRNSCTDYNLSNWVDKRGKTKAIYESQKIILTNRRSRAVFIPENQINTNDKTFANFTVKILVGKKDNIKVGFIFLDSSGKEIKITANRVQNVDFPALYSYSVNIPKGTFQLKPYIHLINNLSRVEISETSLLLLK